MPNYCVNVKAQPNGDHEVHDVSKNQTCLPNQEHRVDLGWSQNCQDAVRVARSRGYFRANGCYRCARECHTT